jgi:hypothetical protein
MYASVSMCFLALCSLESSGEAVADSFVEGGDAHPSSRSVSYVGILASSATDERAG